MAPYSKFTLWREQRIILANASGSWNRFTAEDYASQFKALAMPLAGEDWAHIAYLDNWQLGAPEIEPIIKDLMRWGLNNDLRYTALVYCPNMVKQYQLDRMIIESNSIFEKRVYPNQQDALAWLAGLGFGSQCQNLLQGG